MKDDFFEVGDYIEGTGVNNHHGDPISEGVRGTIEAIRMGSLFIKWYNHPSYEVNKIVSGYHIAIRPSQGRFRLVKPNDWVDSLELE